MIACDSNFVIHEIITIKNIGMDLMVNDHLSKIVLPDNMQKFLEFTFKLRDDQVAFGVEMSICDDEHGITIMNFGGIGYRDHYIITAFSNYLDLYAELMTINNEYVNILREKIKKNYANPDNYQKFTELNNEIINMQRELYKKNAYVSDLLKKKQEMLQIIETQKNFLQQMIDVIPDMIFYKDKNGAYLGCNKAFAEKFIGLPEEEIIGKRNEDFIHEIRNEKFLEEKDQPILIAGEYKISEVLMTMVDGRVYDMEMIKTPFEDAQGNIVGIIGIARDISKRKQHEFEIIKAKEAAMSATMMKSQFLANMSHEIRTPMNGILGFLELLQHTELTTEQTEYLKEARRASEILLYLISDILDLSKIEAGKIAMEKTCFNIRNIIEEVVAIFLPKTLEKSIKFHTLITSSVPADVIGDPGRLRQILNNLLSNAVKFTEQGEISVRVDCVDNLTGQGVFSFEVQDTGIGISEQNINKLFSPFVQAELSTTRKFGGTGLGLAISKELIKLMNGDISIESKIGKGTIFRFTVMLEIDKKTKGGDVNCSNQTAVKSEMVTGNRGYDDIKNPQPKILLVEDDEINRKIVIAILKEKNMVCDVAVNGREAVRIVGERDYDIVFMDCQMPVMDGYESVATIRAMEGEKKHTKIIAMTANAMAGDRNKSIEAGMDDYISKPIDFKKMFKFIEESRKYKQ